MEIHSMAVKCHEQMGNY